MKKLFILIGCAAMMACSGKKTDETAAEADSASTNGLCADVEAVTDASEVDAAVIDASGLRAVDLGLSVNWAATNLGADDDEQYGDFLTWDEAMRLRFSDGWRLPTIEEWEELEACRFDMVQRPSEYRVFVVHGKDGSSIALTTNGYVDEDGNQDFGFYGYYWSSSRSSDGLYPYAFRLSVPDDSHWTDKFIDDMRIGIRLVRPNPHRTPGPSEDADTI